MAKPKRLPLKLPPGLKRAGTIDQSQGRWFDANGIRFLSDTIQPIGGWRRMPDASGAFLTALTGIPRGAHSWRSTSGAAHLAVGTTQKLYAIASGVLADITPVGFTTGRTKTTAPQTGGTSKPSSKYGQGVYSSGSYGLGSTTSARLEADTWQIDTFVRDTDTPLVAVCTSDKKLYVWDGNILNKAAVPAGAPSSVAAAVVTPEGFLLALGADGNVRRVRWASQKTYDVWTPALTNSAGDWDLNTDGRILCGRKTRRETLIFTDVDVWTATYVGSDTIYRFDQAGDQCGIVSPNAVAVLDTDAIWMSFDKFVRYDGYVRQIPCDIHDKVFSDFNRLQAAKITCTTFGRFGEVWWFYPSATSEENDRYVCYNYREEHWSCGTLARTAGVDAGAFTYPVLLAPTGEIYEHEVGDVRTGMTPYLESGPVELGDGDVVYDVLGIVPDEKTRGQVQARFFARYEVLGDETQYGPFSFQPSAVADARFSARAVRLRLDEVAPVSWRVGTQRLVVVPSGLR